MSAALYDLPLNRLDGVPTSLTEFRGQVLLIVNVASQCGLTTQYTALEQLFESRKTRGFQVLGFPCNDFAGQEPGSAEEIAAFCSSRFNVRFPLFAKLTINQAPRHPLYASLIAAAPVAQFPEGSDFVEKLTQYGCAPKAPGDVLWNFEKFLIGRQGEVLGRFSPDTLPDDPHLLAAIDAALSAPAA